MATASGRAKYAPLHRRGPSPLEVEDAPGDGDQGAPSPPPGLPWAKVLCVYVITFGDLVSLQIFAPFMPEMARTRFGLGEADAAVAVGVVQSTFNVFNFGGALLFGYVSDHLGRKELIQCGLLLTVGVTLGLPFCRRLWQVILVRAVAGLFSATFALSKASLADLTRPLGPQSAGQGRDHRRALAFAYHGAVAGLSRAFSSGIGGVATGVGFPGLSDEPYFVPCLIAAVTLGVGLIASAFLPETASTAPEEKLSLGNLRKGLAAVGQDPFLKRALACNAINHAGNGGLLTAGVLFLTLSEAKGGHGMSVYMAGMTFMAFGLFAVAFQVVCFPVINRWLRPRKFYLLGCACLATGVFLTPLTAMPVLKNPSHYGAALGSHTVALLAAAWVLVAMATISLCGIGFMACLPVLNTIVANQTRDDQQGLVTGLSTATGFLARSAGPFGAGALIAWGVASGVGVWPCYLATSSAYLACFAIAYTLVPSDQATRAQYVTLDSQGNSAGSDFGDDSDDTDDTDDTDDEEGDEVGVGV